MKFGQGEARGVSMKLPPLDKDPLSPSRSRGRPEILLGAPVWGCAGWKGSLYPENAKTADFLTYYARALPAIELNATFYGIPPRERLEKWAAQTPEGFLFCPKLPRAVSHSAAVKTRMEVLARFWNEFQVLGSRWGLSFLQLPETFDTRAMKVLEGLLKEKPEGASLAIEFRHPDWFSEHALISEARGLLEFYACVPVISDTLAKRHSLHQSFVGREAMVRFLGTEDPASDQARLSEWSKRLEELGDEGVERVYFFVHQPREEFAAETLARFSEVLAASTKLSLRQEVQLHSEIQPELF
jgi:uncharacterized protein YecE (DUF72 family)